MLQKREQAQKCGSNEEEKKILKMEARGSSVMFWTFYETHNIVISDYRRILDW
jgi:hypothetical protein